MSARLVNAVVVGGLLVAAVVLAFIIFSGGESHTLRAGFDNAIQVTSGQEVRIAGRGVGQVDSVKLVDGQATVTLKITDGDVWPLPDGTTARTRFGSTTAYLSRYIELYPGKEGGGTMDEGAIVQTESAQELDQFYRIFKQDTDEQTSDLLENLGKGLDGQGDNLRRGLAAAPKGLDGVGDLTREIAYDEERLRTLAVAGDATLTALAEKQDELGDLVTNAAGTIEEFAAHTTAQQQALESAPGTFALTTDTLRRFDVTLDGLTGLVRDIRPGAPALRDLAGTARGTLEELRTVSPLISSTLDQGTSAAPRLKRLFDTAAPFLPRAQSSLRTFNPMLACLRPYGPEIAGFLSTWTGQLKNYDQIGHYARSFPLSVIPALPPGTGNTSEAAIKQTPGTLTYAMPRAPGLNAGQPWFRPECGTSRESMDPNKDPEAGR
jgi:ABC-type transporter Mla subunit MlaD